MLLTAAWRRFLVAAAAVACLWAAVFRVPPSAPKISPAEPAVRVAARPTGGAASQTGALHAVVWSGMAAPGGGRFDRFDVAAQPVVAPVNAHGQVAFFATVLHAAGREGIFLAEAEHVREVAAFGDPLPGGGTLAEFSEHPLPALNAKGHVAFTAHIAGGRATEGVFLAGEDGVRPIALAGDDAPGVPLGVFGPFILMTNSYNGLRALAFDIGFLRKVCKNGRLLPDTIIRFKFTHMRRDIETISFDVSHERLAKLKASFGSYLDVLRVCPVRTALCDRYTRELGENAYALLNVITEFASHPPANRYVQRERHSLQRLAGTWLSSFAQRCQQPAFDLTTYLAELTVPKTEASGG